MKKTKFAILAALIGTSALLLSGCFGDGLGPRHGRGPGGSPDKMIEKMAERMSDKLDFTKEQKIKLDSIVNDVKTKMKAEKDEPEKMHKKILDLAKSEKIDRESIIKIIDEHTAKVDKNKGFVADKIVELNSILTPVQRKKLVDFMEERFKDRDCDRD